MGSIQSRDQSAHGRGGNPRRSGQNPRPVCIASSVKTEVGGGPFLIPRSDRASRRPQHRHLRLSHCRRARALLRPVRCASMHDPQVGHHENRPLCSNQAVFPGKQAIGAELSSPNSRALRPLCARSCEARPALHKMALVTQTLCLPGGAGRMITHGQRRRGPHFARPYKTRGCQDGMTPNFQDIANSARERSGAPDPEVDAGDARLPDDPQNKQGNLRYLSEEWPLVKNELNPYTSRASRCRKGLNDGRPL